MQSDDVVWSIVGHQFCSYKIKSKTHQTFCRNEYNLTGLCNRQSCPLANSRYATVREREGIVYLYVKTVERAHSPKRQWERIRLSSNYTNALEQIDKELVYWPNFITHKAKQRLTKITQYLIKLRKIKLKAEEQPKLVGIKKKTERREATREAKALRAARLEKSIEKELLERLKSGAYGDAPLNVNEDVWNSVLESRRERESEANRGAADALELEDEESEEDDEEELEEWDREMEEYEDEQGVGDREFVSDDDESEDEQGDLEDLLYDSDGNSIDMASESDAEDSDEDDDEPQARSGGKRKQAPSKGAKEKRHQPPKKGKKGGGGGARVEIEYEQETEPLTKEQLSQW